MRNENLARKFKSFIETLNEMVSPTCKGQFIETITKEKMPSKADKVEEMNLRDINFALFGKDSSEETYIFVVVDGFAPWFGVAQFSFDSTFRTFFENKLLDIIYYTSEKKEICSVREESQKNIQYTQLPDSNKNQLPPVTEEDSRQAINIVALTPMEKIALENSIYPNYEDLYYRKLANRNPIDRIRDKVEEDEISSRFSLDGITKRSSSVSEALSSINSKIRMNPDHFEYDED